ncbi:MAG TPA: DoxX family protein [Candidatus Jorgensenbacteria bacterium]|nr:DoxX family protein [Candidatus Jorgensenbacteria bacterium]
MLSILTPLAPFSDIVILIVRIIMGVIMIYYGYPKIINLKSNAEDFVKMGFKPGIFWGTIVAFVEFFGGIAVIIGMYMWLAVALFGFEMIMGTIWKITKTEKPFTDWSYDLLLLAIALMLFITGPGFYVLAGF